MATAAREVFTSVFFLLTFLTPFLHLSDQERDRSPSTLDITLPPLTSAQDHITAWTCSSLHDSFLYMRIWRPAKGNCPVPNRYNCVAAATTMGSNTNYYFMDLKGMGFQE